MLQSMGFAKSQTRLAEQQQNIWQIHLIRVIQKVLLLKMVQPPRFLSSCSTAHPKGLLLTACTEIA